MTGPKDRAAAGGDRFRAGHADREQVIQVLKDAFVQDRLTRDELDERTARALTVRGRAELAALTADIPGDLAAGPVPVRPPAAARASLVRRRPLVFACAGAGSCLAIAFGLVMFAANVLDPDHLGNPYHPWSALCALLAFATLFTGLCLATHGVGTAVEQRRAHRQTLLGTPPGLRRTTDRDSHSRLSD